VENDLQLRGSYESSPPCTTVSIGLYPHSMMICTTTKTCSTNTKPFSNISICFNIILYRSECCTAPPHYDDVYCDEGVTQTQRLSQPSLYISMYLNTAVSIGPHPRTMTVCTMTTKSGTNTKISQTHELLKSAWRNTRRKIKRCVPHERDDMWNNSLICHELLKQSRNTKTFSNPRTT